MFEGQWRGWLATLTLALLTSQCGPKGPADSPTPASDAARPAEPDSTAIAVGQLARGELPSQIPIEADDAIWGAAGAPVTLVVFVDFQCPFCARAQHTVHDLMQRYGDQQLRVVFKHLPLDFHRDAVPAAVALQAVLELGGNRAAVRYADKLLSEQHALSESNLVKWAEELGMGREQITARLGAPRLLAAIDNDIALAQRHGIDGTPTFLINGALLVGAQPLEQFTTLIDKELAATRTLKNSGIDAAEVYALRVAENVQAGTTETTDQTVYRVPLEGSPSIGPEDALVTIVEFSEFQCPFCERVRPTLERLRERFPKDVRLVFKHKPLDFHEQALPAARLSAEIQRVSGDEAFWKAATELFDGELSQELLIQVATRHGLSLAQAQSALSGAAGEQRVDLDLNLAEDLRAQGTPHFFVNGKRLAGARPYQEFEQMVLEAMREARSVLEQGIEPGDYYARLMAVADPHHGPREVTLEVPNDGHPSWGPKTAPLVVHAFSDFECNFCARVEPALAQLRKQFPTQLRMVWHNLPLASHDHARPAAAAALEAYAQRGDAGFRKMHELLFASHRRDDGPQLSAADLTDYAKQAGLDVARFEAALTDGRHGAAIDADVSLAERLRIEGTPGFVVGRHLITGAKSLRYLRTLVQRSLDEARAKHEG